jgi:eukaryotic-like serine/threonine-protein kinase
MPLSISTRLGPYEIVAPLGAGGMGEVYRARDTRLGRDVAVKVLSAGLTANGEVRARFEREARTVSSLNHPHICTLFDVGREGETDYLVMELVEGETLASRLARGPLPASEVLRLGIQIADALDRAHQAGVVHRDLKPGNVMLGKGGVKLMDFGLARATGLEGPGPGSRSGTLAGLSQSPTMATPLTAEGTIVGTFQYMAPEQLEGREADERSDVWALGCVLYEMATGKRAFEGRSQASLIASIMHAEPPAIATVAPMAPPALDRLVRGCLAKEPDTRIRTAHDVMLQLQWIAEGGSASAAPVPALPARTSRERLAWLVAGVAGLAALALGAWPIVAPKPAPPATRFDVLAEPGAKNIRWPRISPDGRTLAYLADDSSGLVRIWIRPLDALTATPLPGTENVGRPYWSPDGRSLAFSVGGEIRRIGIGGGPSQLIAKVPSGYDGTWGRRGVILFDGTLTDSIRQVPADGGEVTAATRLDRAKGELYHAWPFFLPDGRHFLFLTQRRGSDAFILKIAQLGSLDSREIGPVPTRMEFAPPNHVLYVQDGTLMTRPIDVGGAKFTAGPTPVLDQVLSRGDEANMSVSTSGTLVALSGVASGRSALVWVDRNGRTIEQVGPPGGYRDFALSRDGTRLAYGIEDAHSGTQDLWVRDLRRNIATRVTFDSKNEMWPVWSPDGSRIAYSSNESGNFITLARASNGTGPVDTLLRSLSGPTSWSSDGRLLFGIQILSSIQMWSMAPRPGAVVTPIQADGFNEQGPKLSPDGHWLAYYTNESGASEVYVQAFPGPGGKWRISTGGGTAPCWRADGRELFYRTRDGTIMAVPIRVEGAGLDAGTPVALFQRLSPIYSPVRNTFDASSDGQRFLLNVPVDDASRPGAVHVLMNWSSQLRKP